MASNASRQLVVIFEMVGLVLSGGASAQTTAPLMPADAARGPPAQQASAGPASGGPPTSAPSPQAGSPYVPESSKPRTGPSAHTNYLLRSANGKKPVGLPAPSAGAFGGPLTR